MNIHVETEEELILIRNHIIYPLMLSVLQNNLDELKLSSQTLKPLYIKTTEIIMNLITKDMAATKRELQRADIKVFDRDTSKYPHFEHEYIVRGYRHRFGMRREKVKAEISMMLPSYVNKVLKSMVDA